MIRKRPYSKRYRNRLLRLASFLDGRAAAIRAHVKAHTPRRAAKAPRDMDDSERYGEHEPRVDPQTGFIDS